MSDLKVQAPETFRQKIFLLVLEKLFLACLIVIVGGMATFAATLFSDRLNTVWGFQEKIYDKRFEAYAELQKKAADILTEIAIVYNPSNPPDDIWDSATRRRLTELEERFMFLSTEKSHGFGASSSYNSIKDVLHSINALFDTKRRYGLLIPNDLESVLNNFINAVAAIVDKELIEMMSSQSQTSEDERSRVRQQRWLDIFTAYRELKFHLRATLGLDLTPVNMMGK
jgi:hypothetical protein